MRLHSSFTSPQKNWHPLCNFPVLSASSALTINEELAMLNRLTRLGIVLNTVLFGAVAMAEVESFEVSSAWSDVECGFGSCKSELDIPENIAIQCSFEDGSVKKIDKLRVLEYDPQPSLFILFDNRRRAIAIGSEGENSGFVRVGSETFSNLLQIDSSQSIQLQYFIDTFLTSSKSRLSRHLADEWRIESCRYTLR